MIWTTKYSKKFNWHKWFAWFPVGIGDNKMIWWEKVERRKQGNQECIYWEYKLIRKPKIKKIVKSIVKSEAEIVKAKLAKEKKVNFLIPLEKGENPGAYEEVMINGHRITIKKGVLVKLPRPIAKILAEKYRIKIKDDK